MKRLVLFGLALLYCWAAQAQQTSGQISVPQSEVKQETVPKKFGIALGIEAASDLRNVSEYESSRESTYSVAPSYQITEALKVSAAVAFVHNLKQAEESDLKNTKIKLSHAAIGIVPDVLAITPAVSGTLPTNTGSRKDQSLQGAAGAEGKLALDLKKWGVPGSVIYGIAGTRNFHEWTRSNTGAENIEYGLVNSLAGALNIGEKISVSVSGALSSGLTYRGVTRSQFELGQEVGYQATSAVSVALGHVNGGNTLKSDMQKSNVEFFNSNTSTVYAGLQVIY